jgi:protocatechuate 3,4-dioxygenase beta subunit
MISGFDLERTQPNWALAFEFDIVLRGSTATPFEHVDEES